MKGKVSSLEHTLTNSKNSKNSGAGLNVTDESRWAHFCETNLIS